MFVCEAGERKQHMKEGGEPFDVLKFALVVVFHLQLGQFLRLERRRRQICALAFRGDGSGGCSSDGGGRASKQWRILRHAAAIGAAVHVFSLLGDIQRFVPLFAHRFRRAVESSRARERASVEARAQIVKFIDGESIKQIY